MKIFQKFNMIPMSTLTRVCHFHSSSNVSFLGSLLVVTDDRHGTNLVVDEHLQIQCVHY